MHPFTRAEEVTQSLSATGEVVRMKFRIKNRILDFVCLIKKFRKQIFARRSILTLKRICFANLILTSIMRAKLDEPTMSNEIPFS